LERLISNETGLFIAKDRSQVIAYAMAASWSYWKEWAMFKFMIEELPKLSFLNQTLTTENSYQYGPVCIDKKVRGTGLLESLFDFTCVQMSKRYPIMVTFINKNNPRSYEAHTRKLGMTTIHEFKFNNNEYYELAYDSYKEK